MTPSLLYFQIWNDPMCGNVAGCGRGRGDHSALQAITFFLCIVNLHLPEVLPLFLHCSKIILTRYPLALAPDWYRVSWAQHQKNIRGLPSWQGALAKVSRQGHPA